MSAVTHDGIEVKDGQQWRQLANERRTVCILDTNAAAGTANVRNVKTGVFETIKIGRMHNWAGGWELVRGAA